jgi:hypothetical protein
LKQITEKVTRLLAAEHHQAGHFSSPPEAKQQATEDLLTHCKIPPYDDFLEDRRKLMAQKIKMWFEAL